MYIGLNDTDRQGTFLRQQVRRQFTSETVHFKITPNNGKIVGIITVITISVYLH